MENGLTDKIVDAIKLTIIKSNPFLKSNILIKRAYVIIFITFGFTLVNYFTLKNILKKQTELRDEIKKLENKVICKPFNSYISRNAYKMTISKSTSTSDLLRENKDSDSNTTETEYELLDDCYDILPCNNLKKCIT
jgi:hypothetical protein